MKPTYVKVLVLMFFALLFTISCAFINHLIKQPWGLIISSIAAFLYGYYVFTAIMRYLFKD